jgi:hypothetical protein
MSFQICTHGDTDFGLVVDQFPSESLCQRCHCMLRRIVHTVNFSWWCMSSNTVRTKSDFKLLLV